MKKLWNPFITSSPSPILPRSSIICFPAASNLPSIAVGAALAMMSSTAFISPPFQVTPFEAVMEVGIGRIIFATDFDCCNDVPCAKDCNLNASLVEFLLGLYERIPI